MPVAKAGDYQVVVFILRREQNKTYVTAAPSGGKIAYASDGASVPRVVGVPVTGSGSVFTFATAGGNDVGGPGGPTVPDGVPDQVRIGDWVADNRGYVYLVNGASANGFTVDGSIPFATGRTTPTDDPITAATTVWYAPPPTPTDSSPCTRIILLSGVVAATGP